MFSPRFLCFGYGVRSWLWFGIFQLILADWEAVDPGEHVEEEVFHAIDRTHHADDLLAPHPDPLIDLKLMFHILAF